MLPGCLLAGFAVYTVFSYLLVPLRITLPLSFTMGILIFGLTKYYSSKSNEIESTEYGSNTSRISLTQIILIAFFIIALLIVTVFPYNIESRLFTDWQNIDALQIIRILSAIGICFFLPGYVIVVILERETKLTAPLKFLLAYSFSILITGLIGYVGASLGYELSDRRILISSTSVVLLVLFLVNTIRRSDGAISNANLDHSYKALLLTWNKIRRKNSQIIIIGSLFMLVIISTYYINNGKIVVDQWFYHGRAILMNTAAYRDLSTAETYIDPYESKTSDVNQINPPFFSSLLSAFFNLSGAPSVNSYVFINFLNIIPLIAFYYFVVSWIHHRNQRAIMLALSFFMLSSGFGWIYALYDSTLTDPMTSTRESIDLLSKTTDATYDVGLPTTFLNVGHPDITTPFIIVALPVGLTLLGLLGDTHSICGCVFKNSKNLGNIWSKIKTRNISLILCFIIITVLTFLGILAHDEFYLFVIIGSTLMLFRKPNIKSSSSVFYAAFLSAIILVILVDIFISPTNYYTQREIFSVPLILLCFIYVTASWVLYLAIRAITSSTNLHISITAKKIRHIIPQRVSNVIGLVLKDDNDRRKLSTLLKIAIASTVVYLYLFTFFVWTQVPVQDTLYYVKDQWNVPSYMLPVKFGLVGILALALVISHIFKKFEKDIFIFGMIALIAFVAGPYYDEHRFGKYVMASLDVLAAILIYRIISSSFLTTKLRLKPLLTGLLLGSVIIGSGLSVLMFAGYVELLSTRPDYLEGGRRDFPTEQEFKLLNFLQDRMVNSKIYNIAVPEKEVDVNRGLVTTIYGFTGIPRLKLIQSPLTLNSSTLEGLYASLVNTDTSYIVLPKPEFIHKFGQENLPSSSLSNNIIKFIIDNFPNVYQDSNYIVLKVPPLSPPVEDSSNVGLVYQKDSSLLFPEPHDNSTLSSTYSRYHYPLNILALSNTRYDTFVDDDYTLFSKEVVVLPYDPFPLDGNNLSRYLDYVKSGGKLIVINSDTNNLLQGSFAKLLSIELGSQRNFNAILPASESDSTHMIQKNNLNISGVAQNIILNSTSNDTKIQSYYAYSTNDGKYKNMVAPFSIEKTYGNGKIIFVNAVGYFDAISKHSSSKKINNNDSYFMSLGKVLALMNLEFGDQFRDKVASYQITSAPATRIVGDLKLAANETVLLNSSSLSFPHSESGNKIYSYDMSVKELSILNSSKISYLNKISNGTSGQSSNNTSLSYSSGKTDSTVDNGSQFNNENITIRNLKLYGGPFEINIISTKNKIPIELPTSSSHHDYIGISIPTGFDIKIKFPPDNSTYVEFDATNTVNKKQTYETFRISSTDIGTNASKNSNGSNEIHLRDVRADLGAIKSISVLMKSPEITVLKRQQTSNHPLSSSGNISISFNEDSHEGSPIEIKNNAGNITARIAYSDIYNNNNKSGTKTQFVTYLDEDFKVISDDSSIHSPARLTGAEKKMQLPGDISEVAKKRGMQLPWLKELGSNTSIILGVLAVVIAIALSRLLLVNSDKQPSNR